MSYFSTDLSVFPSLTGAKKLIQVRSKMLTDFLSGISLKKTTFPIFKLIPVHCCCSENSRHLERAKKNSQNIEVKRLTYTERKEFPPTIPTLSQCGKNNNKESA